MTCSAKHGRISADAADLILNFSQMYRNINLNLELAFAFVSQEWNEGEEGKKHRTKTQEINLKVSGLLRAKWEY